MFVCRSIFRMKLLRLPAPRLEWRQRLNHHAVPPSALRRPHKDGAEGCPGRERTSNHYNLVATVWALQVEHGEDAAHVQRPHMTAAAGVAHHSEGSSPDA